MVKVEEKLKEGDILKGRYEIIKRIGAGGHSLVYKAKHINLDKEVVVKVIKSQRGSVNDKLMQNLKKESDILKDLDHPCLPRIYDILEDRDPYTNKIVSVSIVMDYINGKALNEVLIEQGKIDAESVIEWAKQLSDVLSYIHTRKNPILHRDLKPGNIMLTSEGRVKLIDFGISSMDDEDNEKQKKGMTASYASPEQKRHDKLDARSDIYSLGITLFVLITAISPKGLKPIRQIDPRLPEGLEHIINKCTQVDLANRYQSCREIAYDLENINKLTKDYKVNLLKQIKGFGISFGLFIFFIIVTGIGYAGVKSDRLANYKSLINKADTYLVDGNYKKAIEVLDEVIMKVDGGKEEAYIKVLNIYANMNNITDGLAKVEGYVNDKYAGVNKNDEVLFKLGMSYLDMKNYPIALKYFRAVNDKKLKDAKYYKTLATSLSSMNINYDEFAKDLLEFEAYNDTLPNDEKKIANYNSLANIYISYKGSLANSNDKVIEIVNKANDILFNMNDETIVLLYEANFINKLAQAYHSKGINETDKSIAADYFEQAIEKYQEILDIDGGDVESTLIKIGEIYNELGNITRAIEHLNMAIAENNNSLKAYVKMINILIDVELNKNESSRNFSDVNNKFNIARSISGSNEDKEFTKLQRMLERLGII